MPHIFPLTHDASRQVDASGFLGAMELMVDWEKISGAAKILVIAADAVTREALATMLERGGYRNIWTAADPARGIELFREVQPDLVLTELSMEPHDGAGLLRQLHAESPSDGFVPILVITDDAKDAKLNALVLGAKDVVTRPIDVVETMLRIRIRLETRFKVLELERTIHSLRGPS